MDRRDALKNLGLGALAGMTSQIALAETHDHHHHHHAATNQYSALIESAAHCIMSGQACLNHCFELLGNGEKEMAACAKSVSQMLAACTALQQLASLQSPFTRQMAKVAEEICVACEKECRKHAKKHQECLACADSCAACIRECKSVASA